MRALLALAFAIVAFAATIPTAEACSARGRYCSYPTWAANAFEGPTGHAPRFAILPGTAGSKRKSR